MNCMFCQKDTQKIDTQNPGVQLEVYKCDDCNVRWGWATDYNELIAYSIRCQHDNKIFQLTCNPRNNTCYISSVDSNGRYTTIAQFDFIPDITPQNFKEKLPTIITFS